MNEVLHANIFFFITSVAVVLLTILVCWALYYIVGILKNVRDISERVDKKTIELEADLDELRDTIKHEGVKITSVYHFIMTTIKSFLPKPKRRVKQSSETDA